MNEEFGRTIRSIVSTVALMVILIVTVLALKTHSIEKLKYTCVAKEIPTEEAEVGSIKN